MQRKIPILTLTVFISLCTSLSCLNKISGKRQIAKAEKPNILFIIADDLSAEALGTYGNKESYTPNIDLLAKRGILYHRMYSQYPVCGPSRAALMTGMYPEKLGVMSNGQSHLIDSLLSNRPTMAEHFKLNGYTTTRLSKIYHMRVPGDITAGVDGPDHQDSWDYRYNFKGDEWMSPGKHAHLSNEQLIFDENAHYNLGFGTAFYAIKTEDKGVNQPDYRATSKAIEILKSHQHGQDQPFFLSIGFVRPHVPLVAPQELFDKYNHTQLSLPATVEEDLSDIPELGISKTSAHYGLTDPIQQRKVIEAYYASVSFIDDQVGRLVNALDKYGLREKTILVFTSDHGYHLGEHEFWQKLSLHEESTRIPFIISGKNITPSTSFQVSEQIDIYPTLSKLAHLNVPKHVQGKVLPIYGQELLNRKGSTAYSVTNKGKAIRTDDWTYIRYRDGSEELYDMNEDPHQFTNLSKQKKYDSRKLALIQLLEDKQKKTER